LQNSIRPDFIIQHFCALSKADYHIKDKTINQRPHFSVYICALHGTSGPGQSTHRYLAEKPTVEVFSFGIGKNSFIIFPFNFFFALQNKLITTQFEIHSFSYNVCSVQNRNDEKH
jgi:hypothetical protein